MIKINLTPFEELENPLWWVPDVLLFVTVTLCGFFGAQFYLSDSKERISSLTKEMSSLEQGTKSLASDVKKHDELESDNKALKNKLSSLGKLTASEVVRYKPIILLEHLQNLNPVGVWFQEIQFKKMEDIEEKSEKAEKGEKPEKTAKVEKPKGSPTDVVFVEETISVSGRALDNILVAEFLAALRSTQTQDVDPRDLRTHVYFSDINLVETKLEAATDFFGGIGSPNVAAMPNSKNTLSTFQLNLMAKEHKVEKPKDNLTTVSSL